MPPRLHSSSSEAQGSPVAGRCHRTTHFETGKGLEWQPGPQLSLSFAPKQYAFEGAGLLLDNRTWESSTHIDTHINTDTDLFIFLEASCKIMSLHHHHHHQQQQQQETAAPTSTTTTFTTSTVASTGVQSSTTQAHQQQQQQQRFSSSSASATFHHRHHLHHHYLPPRPPSTTSSGSISTGFPDDLQDDLVLPPVPDPPASTTASFSFHPAHHHPHTLQYHRHTSPNFPQRGGGGGGTATTASGGGSQVHHHHHHFVPPGQGQIQHGRQQSHQHHLLQPLPVSGGGGGGASAGHVHGVGCSSSSSRAASRQTYVDDGEDPEGGGDEENLLLVDNSVGVQDVVYLDPVTTDNFLTNIVQRFKRDFIYTYVGEGTLLVSVNPYKPLSIFSPRVKAAYRNISNPFQLPPHIYGQLCLILQRNTSSLERTQTLLLTGESGSGKSTNLSYLLDFLATKHDPSSASCSASRPSRSRRNSGRSTGGGSTRGGGGGSAHGHSHSQSYYLSTGSLHRHQQVHIPSCPQHVCPGQSQSQSQQYNYHTGGGGGGSGRASSLSLTAPSHPGGVASSTIGTGSGPNMALTLLQGNFLLNAFGNCKTSKNWDASRFGKLVQLQIDFLGNVVGGRILSYQLEKWRVQGPIHNSGGPHPSGSSTEPSPSSSSQLSSSSSTGASPAAHAYERNFHIFYILLAGADSSTLKSLRLTRNLETYAMLNVKNHSSFLNASQTNPSTPFCPQDHYYQVKGSRQGSSSYEGCFQLVRSTLTNILSSSSSSISADHVFRILAAVLKLNNLVFAPVANIDGTEGCDVTNEQDLHDLGVLLNILPSATGPTSISSPTTPNNGSNNHNHQHPLKTILTSRRVTRSDGSVAQVELTASESSSLRNSLTVSLYTRLFSWLTKQVSFSPNAQFHPIAQGGKSSSTASTTTPGAVPPPLSTSTSTATTTTTASAKHNLLNIVDFYGFEVFQTNSIEQFLINFTNEKIQYVLADLRLRMLQEEFVKDGLEWITIDTAGASPSGPSSNNSSNPPGKLIDLVEENCHGLLSIFANCGNDHDLEKQFARRFSSPKGGGDEQKEQATSTPSKSNSNAHLVEYLQQSFRLRHWAGPVTYSTRQFATKNRDTLPPHLPHQLYTWTSDPLLRSLFSHDGRSTPALFESSITSSRLLATSNMELSLRNLFQKCSSSSKHHRIYYIRCLKPNELSQPAAELCELALLKHQVKYHRLIDFVRVYRDGFTYNLGAFEFLERYKLLSLNTWPNWRLEHDVKFGIQVLMKDLQMKEGLDWCFGGGGLSSAASPSGGDNPKVYLKGQRILSELEDFRRERLDDLALLIQKIWRGYRDWKEYRRMKNGHNVICKAWRKYLQCKKKEQRKMWKTMKTAVRLIQQKYILWKRRLFLKQLIMQVRTELQHIGGGAGGGMMLGGLCPSLAGGPVMLPSTGSMLSPICRDWPYSPSYLEEASFQLRRVFHRWRCRLYRSWFNETERAKMAEKVTASILFKDKKTSYTRSVSHPYLGDYIRLRSNSQWRRTTTMMMLQAASQSSPQSLPCSGSGILDDPTIQVDSSGDVLGRKQMLPAPQLQIVFADLINKITRSSGKFLPIVLVVTTTQVMILDPRTLNVKYKIPAAEIWRLSVSPYGDDICVLHLQQPMRCTSGSIVGPVDQAGLFGQGVLSDDDDAYYQFGDEPSPTANSGGGGCVCSSSRDSQGAPPPGFLGGGGVAGGVIGGSAYYAAGIEQPSPSPQQHQCQPGSGGGCGLFGGGGDTDSGQYVTSEVVKLTKGDLVLHTCHLIEMVTKIYLVVKNATGKGPELIISNEFPAVFNNQRVQLYFRYSKSKSSKHHPQSHQNPEPSTEEDRINRVQQSRSPPPILPDGSALQNPSSACLPQIPPPPPPASVAAIIISGKDEPVIPPSQIKITRKKSTRMEFLIGHSS